MRSKKLKLSGLKVDFSSKDKLFMKRVLKLAGLGGAAVLTNPLVGAVLVNGGKIIAEGYHHQFGGVHAEVDCLNNLKKAIKSKLRLRSLLKEAVLYVNLEPCSHFGKTPPCVDLIVESGIKKVVIANFDPNPLVGGKGVMALRKAGIEVKVGLLEKEAAELNQDFFYAIVAKMPYLATKIAATLDGKIATTDGDSFWITNENSRKFVQEVRVKYPAILTTATTVLKDDPHLGLRSVKGIEPLRIIIDRSLKTSPQAKVYRDANVLVVTTSLATLKRLDLFRELGIEVIVYPESLFMMERVLQDLYLKKGLKSILVEAGGTFNTILLKQKLVKKLYYFIAPKILGAGIASFSDIGVQKMAEALSLNNVEIKIFGNDILYIGTL